MWFYKKSFNIYKSAILNGMLDSHSHLLWGVDDGAQSEQKTRELIKILKTLGLKGGFATPHIMSGLIKNSAENLENIFIDKLAPLAQELDFELYLAAEYMIDEAFLNKFSTNKLLCFSNKHILIEMSNICISPDLDESIYQIGINGYTSIIAHPERFLYLSIEDLESLKDRNCKFQLNIPSLAGIYSKQVKQRALELLNMKFYDYIGTDAHSPRMLEYFKKIELNNKQCSLIKELLFNNNTLL